MRQFIERHTFWAIVLVLVIAVFLWLVFAVWPSWLVDAIGRKKTFVNTLINGVTLGGLYFLVASGFTLVFGLMRNVNLAHGSMYLLGGYIGYDVAEATGSWFLGLGIAFLVIALSGALLQVLVFRRMEGDDLRQTLVTIGLSIVAADLMLAAWTGVTYQFNPRSGSSAPLRSPSYPSSSPPGPPSTSSTRSTGSPSSSSRSRSGSPSGSSSTAPASG